MNTVLCFAVFLCATIVGICYWASEEVYVLQYNGKMYKGNAVVVSFDIGVYLITAAGSIAILATASNVIRRYPTEEEE